LVEHFVKRGSRDLNKPVRSVSPEAMRRLETYAWPGNVRELQSAIKYALVVATGEVLTVDCLPASIQPGGQPAGAERPKGHTEVFDLAQFVCGLLHAGAGEIYQKASLEFDRIVLREVLRHFKGNQLQASQILGMSRNTLRSKLRSLGMGVDKHLLSEFDRNDETLGNA
jgi:two-component system nitrogen regulation response regulator GlnG